MLNILLHRTEADCAIIYKIECYLINIAQTLSFLKYTYGVIIYEKLFG